MSISKVGDNKYRIFISDGFNLDGTRRRFTKTITTDLKGKDLKKFLTLKEIEFENEIKNKDPKFAKLSKGTFEQYSIWWLNYKSDLAPKTKEEYQKLLNTRILKYIGKKTLEKITNSDMIELMQLIEDSPAKTKTGKLSPNSIKHYHTLLKIMFNDAVKLKIISENPMDNVPIKSSKAKLKDNYYDLEDIKQLLTLLKQEPIKYQLTTLIAITTGIRLGELTGLQWKHINYEKLEIKIEQANSYTKETGIVIKNTKNTHSERIVAFPKFLVPLLQEHEKNELLKKELLDDNWFYGKDNDHLDDFVFTQQDGRVMFPSTPSKWFNKFIKKHGLKHITFHGLRHTNTTVLINKNIDIVSISKSLGHSKTSTTTDYYAHALESVERKMADTFDEILESGTQSGTQKPKLKVIK